MAGHRHLQVGLPELAGRVEWVVMAVVEPLVFAR